MSLAPDQFVPISESRAVVLPKAYDYVDKKLNFVISDSGEFLDDVYRETEANPILGIFMGRSNNINIDHKRYFTTADVVCKGYLYKKGSWFKNWKKRYFVLRKDIRALCYFESSDNLKLLGTISLKYQVNVFRVFGAKADNFDHVREIQTKSSDDKEEMSILIRADTAEEINRWENEIINESKSIQDPQSDSNGDWWSMYREHIPNIAGVMTTRKREHIKPKKSQTKTLQTSTVNDDDGASTLETEASSSLKDEMMEVAMSMETQSPVMAMEDADISTNQSTRVYEDEEYSDEEDVPMNKNEMTEMMKVADMMEDVSMDLDSIMKPRGETGPERHQRLFKSALAKSNSINIESREYTSDISPARQSATTEPRASHLLSGFVGDGNVRTPFSPVGFGNQRTKLSSGAEEDLAAIRRFALTNKALIQGNRMKKAYINKVKEDKHPSLPIKFTSANRYMHGGKLGGVHLTVELSNICSFQDSVFAAVFSASDSETGKVYSHHDLDGPEETNWKQISVTEIVTINEKPAFGSIFIKFVRVHFALLQEPIPKDSKGVLVVIYRNGGNDATGYGSRNSVEKTKLNNVLKGSGQKSDIGFQSKELLHHRAIAKIAIRPSHWNDHSVFCTHMKVLTPTYVDLSSPGDPKQYQQNVVLGVMKLTSSTLQTYRNNIADALGATPYAETMFSFQSTSGQTLSIEQIYPSNYCLAVPEAMVKYFQLDRGLTITNLCTNVYNNIEVFKNEIQNRSKQLSIPQIRQSLSNVSSDPLTSPSETQQLSGLILGFDLLNQAAEVIHDIQDEFQDTFITVTENCQNCRAEVKRESPSILPLRKSIWKKLPQWQYSATNLNVHLLMSRTYTCEEMFSLESQNNTADRTISTATAVPGNIFGGLKGKALKNSGSKRKGDIHVAPTITLGCPAAHLLRFKEGGLRRMFECISRPEMRLIWLHVIQNDVPWIEFSEFLNENSQESSKLFGHTVIPPKVTLLTNMQFDSNRESQNANSNLVGGRDLLLEIYTLQTKLEIAQRIDIVTSQTLAYALTQVRTIITLATQIGGVYYEVLQRSLKIGFLLGIESLLSTFGDELGMIEDVDIGVEWLSIVTLRLVSLRCPAKMHDHSECKFCLSKNRKSKKQHLKLSCGTSNGVSIRRDENGRLIVDLELPHDEVETVLRAVDSMENFTCQHPKISELIDKPFSKVFAEDIDFNSDPIVPYAENENQPSVLAVTQFCGVLFTQGINEVQSFVNTGISSSSLRDVEKQSQINEAAVKKLIAYFKNYESALEFQMTQALSVYPKDSKPDTVDISSTTRKGSVQWVPGPSEESSRKSPLFHTSSPKDIKKHTKKTLQDDFGMASIEPIDNADVYGEISIEQTIKTIYNKLIHSAMKELDEVNEALSKQKSNQRFKHVDIILKLGSLCRTMGGTIGVICKSGKDRTGMSVTLETTRSIVEDIGVLNGTEICQVLRTHGVRRMNVIANTGQSKFAFNQIQRYNLPPCYRPPAGTHTGNVTS